MRIEWGRGGKGRGQKIISAVTAPHEPSSAAWPPGCGCGCGCGCGGGAFSSVAGPDSCRCSGRSDCGSCRVGVPGCGGSRANLFSPCAPTHPGSGSLTLGGGPTHHKDPKEKKRKRGGGSDTLVNPMGTRTLMFRPNRMFFPPILPDPQRSHHGTIRGILSLFLFTLAGLRPDGQSSLISEHRIQQSGALVLHVHGW